MVYILVSIIQIVIQYISITNQKNYLTIILVIIHEQIPFDTYFHIHVIIL
jgi:hypothetical protein